MGADSKIAWCDDTLNVWMGCEKVSPGCKFCYAEHETPVRVHRGRGLELWGKDATRYETKGWRANLRGFVREAQRTGVRRRIFAQSLSDTFEDRADLVDVRARFFDAIDHLDDGERGTSSWAPSPVDILLLTKRIENVPKMVPAHWLEPGCWPSFVWIGATVEDQENADKRIPHLLRVPAAVRFLSVEPQVGPVDLSEWIAPSVCCENCQEITEGLPLDADGTPDETCPACGEEGGLITTWGEEQARRWESGERYANNGPQAEDDGPQIQWVIQGGESGPKARPFDLAWARSLRDQCRAAGVAYFLKQLGARPTGWWDPLRDSHGGDESEFPTDLRGCRAFPQLTATPRGGGE